MVKGKKSNNPNIKKGEVNPNLADNKSPLRGKNKKRTAGCKAVHDRAIENINRQLSMGRGDNKKVTPLEFLVNIYNDKEERMSNRVNAAKAALEYLHTKQPKPIEVTTESTQTIELRLTADDALSNLNKMLDHQDSQTISHPSILEGETVEAVVMDDIEDDMDD